MECESGVRTCPAMHTHASSRQWDSGCYGSRKSPATQLTGCHVVSELLGNFWQQGATLNHWRIAGVLEIPHNTAPLMERAGRFKRASSRVNGSNHSPHQWMCKRKPTYRKVQQETSRTRSKKNSKMRPNPTILPSVDREASL